MKKLKFTSMAVFVFALAQFPVAQSSSSAEKQDSLLLAQARPAPAARPRANTPARRQQPRVPVGQRQLQEAQALMRSQQYVQAAPLLYNLSRRNDLSKERMQIKYLLGVSLLEQQLYNTAAFQFVDVIRRGNNPYTQQAIEKLTLAADALGDETFLSYAISRVRLENFPERFRDILYYRLGEIRMKNRQYDVATDLFNRVPSNSRYAYQSRFNRGLALLEAKKPAEAVRVYQGMLNNLKNLPVTDTRKVAVQMALARSLYQAEKWDEAVAAYRDIPRDHIYWHDSLFEQSWAYLRSARFRSALSNFQSLHSSFYEDFYLPESLLLRSLVYLYICKYDEMEKVLDLFQKSYGSVRSQVGLFVQNTKDPINYYREIESAVEVRNGLKEAATLKLPYNVARFVMDQGDIKRSLEYIRAIDAEKKLYASKAGWANSPLAKYANRVLERRMRNARISAGEQTRAHLVAIRAELRDLYEQAEFARYEMINGKKEQLRKRIAGKSLDNQIDDGIERQFFVQNGYEYWPFRGEFWLDEIGNYHYLGKQSCE